MKKQIELKTEKVEYSLKKNSRSRRLRLAIHPGGNFVVTAPVGLNFFQIEKYLRQKTNWILEKLKIAKNQIDPAFSHRKSRPEYLALKKNALKMAIQKTEWYAHQYGFRYNKISIRNQKTRWGSCSQKGNLNFNYRISLLPDELADYIVVHELCHLKELNHGRNFWRKVEEILPDYKKRIRQIKKFSFSS